MTIRTSKLKGRSRPARKPAIKRAVKRTVKASGLKRKAKKVAPKRRRQIPFNKLSPRAKRVRIAKDVLAQLRVKRLSATRGIYMMGDAAAPPDGYEWPTELSEVLKSRKAPCVACALGSMFVAAVERADACPASGILNTNNRELYASGDDCYDYLEKFFPHSTLSDIESAFEYSTGPARDRLEAIMKNIVRNKGEFIVDDNGRL